MKSEDRRLREALVQVLDAHDVECWDVNISGAPTIAFRLGRVTHRFAYTADDENRGIVRKLINLLNTNGVTMKELERPPLSVATQASPPSPPPDPQPDPQPIMEESLFEEELLEVEETLTSSNSEIIVEEFVAEESVQPVAAVEEQVMVEPSSASGIKALQGLVVYTPKPDHAPADVFVIEAVREHLISIGDRIVIPVHRPDLLMVLTPEEFEARYMPTAFERPYAPKPEAAPPLPTPAPAPRKRRVYTHDAQPYDPLEALTARETRNRTEPVTETFVAPVPQREPEPTIVPEPVVADDDTAADYPPPAQPQPPSAVKQRRQQSKHLRRPTAAPPINMAERTEPLPTPRVNVEEDDDLPEAVEPETATVTRLRMDTATPGARISVNGVTVAAQLGRIMAGIRQACIDCGHSEVTSGEAASYMPPSDRKQISGRIQFAVLKGWAKIHRGDTGYMYEITSKGDEVIRAAAVACYRTVGLEIPPFIAELEAENRRVRQHA